MIKRVPIMLDRQRYLVYDLAALRKFEEVTGKSAFDFWANIRASDLATFLWVGLLRDDPELTQEQCDSLVDLSSLPEITELIARAYFENAPEESGEGNAGLPTG